MHNRDRRPLIPRHAVETFHFGERIVECQNREAVRHFDSATGLKGALVRDSADSQRRANLGEKLPFHRREFHGLPLGHPLRTEVSRFGLQHCRRHANPERDHERRAVKPIAGMLEQEECVNPGDGHACRAVRGDGHVQRLLHDGRVE